MEEMRGGRSFEEGMHVPSNTSEDNFSPFHVTPGNHGDTFTMFTGPELFWCFGFSTMLSVAVFGNILVIWIVLAHRRMRTVTNYFLLNLAVADLFMALFNAAPNFAYMLQKDWILGSVLCMVNNFVANVSIASSTFTMTAVSVDRYLAIVRPLQPRMTKGMARRAIGAIWLCSSILASPGLMYSKILTFPSAESRKSTKAACIMLWPDGKLPPESNLDFGYSLCLLLVTYLIPMVAMALCYGSMSKELWGHKQIGEAPQRQMNLILSKRKIVRMFIVIVTLFAVSWFPYHAYFIYQYYDNDIVYISWVHHLYFAFYWLAMSTTMINPIIYYFMNARFRNYIREVGLRCCFCCVRRQLDECPPSPEPNLPRMRYQLSNSASRSGDRVEPRIPVPYNKQLTGRYQVNDPHGITTVQHCSTYC